MMDTYPNIYQNNQNHSDRSDYTKSPNIQKQGNLSKKTPKKVYSPYSLGQEQKYDHWTDLFRSKRSSQGNEFNNISEYEQLLLLQHMKQQQQLQQLGQHQQSTSLSEQSNNKHQQQSYASIPTQQKKSGKVYRSISSINVNSLRRNLLEDRQNQNIKFIVQPNREKNFTEQNSFVKIPQLRQKVYFPESNNKSLINLRGNSANNNTIDQTNNPDFNPDAYFQETQRYLQALKTQQRQLELISIYGQTNIGFFQKSMKKIPVPRQNFIYQQPVLANQSALNQDQYQYDINSQRDSSKPEDLQQHYNSNKSNQDILNQNQSLLTTSNNQIENNNNNNNNNKNKNTIKRSSTIDKLPSIYQTSQSSPRKTKNSFYDDDDFINYARSHSSFGSPKKSPNKETKEIKKQQEAVKVIEKQKRRIKMFKTASLVTQDTNNHDEFHTVTGGGDEIKMQQDSPDFSKFAENSIQKPTHESSSQIHLPKINESQQFLLSPIQPVREKSASKDTGTQVDFQAYTNIEQGQSQIRYPKKSILNGNNNNNPSQEQELKTLLQKQKGSSHDMNVQKNEEEDNQSIVDRADYNDTKNNKNEEENQNFISSKYQIMSNIHSGQLLDNEGNNRISIDFNSAVNPDQSKSPTIRNQNTLDSKISNFQGVSALSKIIKPNSSTILKVQKHKYIDPLEDMTLNISPDGAYTNLNLMQDKEVLTARAFSKKSGKGYDLNFKRISSLDAVFPESDVKRIIDVKINKDVSEQYLDFRGESILRVSKLDEYEMEKQLNAVVMEKETQGKGQFLPRNAYIYRQFLIEQFDRFYFLQDQIGTFVVQKEALSEHQFKSMMLNLLDVILAKRVTRITHDNVVFCVADQKFYCVDRLFNYAPLDETSELADPITRQQTLNGQANPHIDDSSYIILQDLIDLIAQIKFQTFSRNQLRQQLQVQSIKSPFLALVIKELQTAKIQQQQVQQQQQLSNSRVQPINVFTQLENLRKNIFKHRLEAHDIIKRDGDIFSYQILMKPRRFREYIDMLYYGSDIYVDQNILNNNSQINDDLQKDSFMMPNGSKQLNSQITSRTSLTQKDSILKSALGAKKLKDAVKKTQKKSLYEIMFDQAIAKKDINRIVEYGNHIFPRRQITKSNIDRLYAYIEAKLEKNDLTDINFYMSKYVQVCCTENPSSLKYGKMQLQLAQHNIRTNVPLSATMLICIYLENKFQNIEKYEIEKRLAYNKLMSELSEQSKIEDFEIAFLRDSCGLLEGAGDIESFSQALFNVSKWYLHQDKVKKGLKYIQESIRITQNEQFKQYCQKIIQNAESSMKKCKLLKDNPNLSKNVKEAYAFYNENNFGEVDRRLQNIKSDLSDFYHLKEREVIDLFYLTAKEQIKYEETASKGGRNLDLFQGYANSSDIYSDEELKNCCIEIYGIYGDLYVKENRNLEALLEYFSKIVLIDSNRHEEFETTLLKMGQMIFELNKGEYLGSLLNCLNSNTVIYKAIETLHLLAKAQVIYLEVEANQYSAATTQYNSTYLLTKALTYVEEAKSIGKQNKHIKLKILLKILDVEYQIIEKLGDPNLMDKRIETLKQKFEQKITPEEQFLLFQEYINIYLIDSSPVFDINFFSKCEKAAEMAINYKFYSHAIKDLEICLNLKMELGVHDVSNEVRSILFILDKIQDKEEIKKCLELIQMRMDSIESDEELLEFILKFLELSQDKEKVVELTLNNLNLIIKTCKKEPNQKIIDILLQKSKIFAEQNAIDESLRLNDILIQILELNEIQNSNLICNVFLNSIRLYYLSKKPETEIVYKCECFFAHLVALSKQPQLNKTYFQEIHKQISTQFNDKTNKFKDQLKNYLKSHKITHPQLLELTK